MGNEDIWSRAEGLSFEGLCDPFQVVIIWAEVNILYTYYGRLA